MKFVFSKVSVRNPDLPLGTHHDEKQRGLVLNITASSRKFGVYISVRNIPTRKSIGDIDHLSVEAARLRAAEIIQELKTQPKGPKVPTLGDLAAAYVRELEKKGRRMPEYVSDTVRLSWTHLKGRKIDTITKEELRETHYTIGEKRGKVVANRAIAVMRTLFAYAINDELVTRNPAKQVTFFKEESRDTYLTAAELVTLRIALEEVDEDTRDLFLLAICTALRRSNLTGCRYDWIDFEQGVVVIPAAESKNKSEMVIPLSDEAIAILKRRQSSGQGEWVFPSGLASGGHLMETSYMLDRARTAAKKHGITKAFTLHDMRRSAGSLLASKGAPITVVAKFLGHKSLLCTGVYMRTNTDELRAWLGR